MRRTIARLLVAGGSVVAVCCGVLVVLLMSAHENAWARVAADHEANGMAAVAALTADPETLRRELGRTDAGREGRLEVSVDGSTVGTLRGGLLPADATGPVLERRIPTVYGSTAVVRLRAAAGGPSADALAAGGLVAAAGLLVAAAAGVAGMRRIRPITAELADLTAWVDAPPGSPEPSGPRTSFPETAGLRAALVRLESQVDRARVRERRMVEDLSHRLRTPLTALFLDVDGLGDGPAATRVRNAVSALDRAVDMLIRTTPEVETGAATCDVVEVVRRRMQFWTGLAQHSGRPVEVVLSPVPAPVALRDDDVAAVLDAVVGNVFRHTAGDVGFRVAVVRHRNWVSLVIDDAGRGIADPAAALRRGVSGAGSTGLGLAIARAAVESTGGTIHLERSSLEGTRVRLRFVALAAADSASATGEPAGVAGGAAASGTEDDTIGQPWESVRAAGHGGGSSAGRVQGVMGG